LFAPSIMVCKCFEPFKYRRSSPGIALKTKSNLINAGK